ncbi:MAG: YbbR-like domain-containing protein, partial [Spirochaetaceae bacterium]
MAPRSKLVESILDNWPAKIIALGLAVVVVLFNNLARVSERTFSVPLTLRVDESLVPGEEFQNRVRVRIRGDESQIFNVSEDDLTAVADFTRHTAEGVFRAPIEIVRRGSALESGALEISVEPLHVTVSLAEKLVRSVEVVPSITGFPPAGYELRDYRVLPTAVTIEGPSSAVADVVQVLTEEIALAGRTRDFTESVRLRRPHPLVDLPGGLIVEFRALIAESVVQRSFDPVAITLLDLDPSLVVAGPLPNGALRVQGRQLDLDAIAP